MVRAVNRTRAISPRARVHRAVGPVPGGGGGACSLVAQAA